jgi:crooked neck
MQKRARLWKVCPNAPSIFFIISEVSTDWDMVFADDERETNPNSFKLLQMAHAWKNAQAKRTGDGPVLSGFTAAANAKEDDAHSDVASSHGDESD